MLKKPLLVPALLVSDAQAEELVYHAFDGGCKPIDTARVYGNEAGWGAGSSAQVCLARTSS